MKWIRQLYNWVIHWAEKPQALWALSGISAIEAIFFPLPADPLLIAMGAAKPRKSFQYATVITLSSVAGALLGYLIGYMFWEASQDFFFQSVFSQETFETVKNHFNDNAFMAIFIASFTPIPFKVFTLAAGAVSLPLLPFTLSALLGRGLRFFIIATLLFFFGETIRHFIEKHFEKLTIILSLLLVGGFYVIKYVF